MADITRKFFIGPKPFSIYDEMALQLKARGWTEERKEARMRQCDVLLGDRFDIPYHLLRTESKVKLINYFKGSHKLTLKASMAKLLTNGVEGPSWLPRTLVLGGKDDSAARELLCGMEQRWWILKPSAGCGGKGIIISNSPQDIFATVDSVNTAGKSVFALQEYIERPLLIHGRKFDIRVWALLAPPYNIYQYSEGSCRTASVEYDMTRTDCAEIHITNHGLQSSSASFGSFEEGNEMWYSELDTYMMEKHQIPNYVESRLKPQFATIIAETLNQVKDMIEVLPGEPFQCFQLFGYDFIVDESDMVHLLEINGSPGAAEKLLKDMVGGIVDLAIEPVANSPAAIAAPNANPSSRWELISTTSP